MLAGGFLTDLIDIKLVKLIFAPATLLSKPFVIRYVPNHVSEFEKKGKSSPGTYKRIRNSYWFRNVCRGDPGYSLELGSFSCTLVWSTIGSNRKNTFFDHGIFLGAGWFIMLSFKLPPTLWFTVLLLLQLTWTMIVNITDSLAADVASKSYKIAIMTKYTVVVDVGASIGPTPGYM
jgi:hypothetical protein